jgi:hypothetical protein
MQTAGVVAGVLVGVRAGVGCLALAFNWGKMNIEWEHKTSGMNELYEKYGTREWDKSGVK